MWNFNRTADPLQLLTRVLLLLMGGHYVDDFNAGVGGGGPFSLPRLRRRLDLFGLRVKESKAQRPCHHHVIQGVDFHVGAEGVTLAPTPNRIRKLARTIGDALRDNALTPAAASRLAGKLAFLTQATFGAVEKAALQSLYSRSHDTSPHTTDELSDGLRAALNAIHAMLRDIQPRFLPFQVQETVWAVIFADA